MLTPALGCLGAALSMSLPWPQVYRSCAQRRTTGLSAAATFLGVALPIGWITYGLLIGDRLQVVTNTVTGAAGLAVLAAVLLAGHPLRKLAVSALGAAGVLLAVVAGAVAAALPAIPGPRVAPLLGSVLAVASFCGAVPQPLALLRDKTQDLSGISALRWRLGAGACSSWLLYGVSTAQPAVWSSAGVGLIAALIVCAVLHLRRTPAGSVAGSPAASPVAAPIRATARVAARGRARVLAPADAVTLLMPLARTRSLVPA